MIYAASRDFGIFTSVEDNMLVSYYNEFRWFVQCKKVFSGFGWTKNFKRFILTERNKGECFMEDKKMKVLKGQIPVSVIYIALGVCLALMPVETVNVLCKVVFGLVLVGAGLYHIVIYVLEKENATILDLFSGVIVLVIGAFLFMNPQVVVKLLTLMLGAFILVDSIWMLRGSMKLRKRKLGVWKWFLLESLVFVALGALILVNPFSEIRLTMQVSGWIFVANGGFDIIFYLLLKHGLKKEIPSEEPEETGDSKEEDSQNVKAVSEESEEAKEAKEALEEWKD